ncbi:leucine-rich repeat domain-containing protein [Sphingobacterium bovistauri]|uniref:Leucine-rich repeat domain-containing protein n=1 Tax=Sphingobacterium bovistauri TaxID=2781959 RepID=A0ABS7Z738_9SPHI|nr:leucine-rich repeat domain-containing protein [Sphingobacterium bovistauri]MCA5005231.1 leucine-rich repeat domain-containing protein [Sphingobacterium bovistauri]
MEIKFDRQIRETIDGKSRIFCYANHFEEAVAFAAEHEIYEFQLRDKLGPESLAKPLDFSLLEKLSSHLEVFSFQNGTKDFDIINFESIYKLEYLKAIYIDNKQKFTLDFTKLAHLEELGCIYWNDLSNFNESKTLKTIVFAKQFPFEDLKVFEPLKSLETLHIYFSKLQSLDGIENLENLKDIRFARCRHLTDISALEKCKSIKTINLESIQNIEDLSVLEELKAKGVKVHLLNVKHK